MRKDISKNTKLDGRNRTGTLCQISQPEKQGHIQPDSLSTAGSHVAPNFSL